MRGYYSLIQFSPDSIRLEAANVGVVLLCPELHFLDCKIARGNDRPRRFFRIEGQDLDRLDELKLSLQKRIQIDGERIRKFEEFQHFIATRGNKLLLTEPRNMRVDDPQCDLDRLFKELVGGRAVGEKIERRGRGLSVRSRLKEAFSSLEQERKVRAHVEVKLQYGSRFVTDYEFKNGKDSYVVAQTIHVDRDQTIAAAERLAYRGDQLIRHGVNTRNAELIVTLPDPEQRFTQTIKEVTALLNEYKVRTVFGSGLDTLAEEVRKYAHPLQM